MKILNAINIEGILITEEPLWRHSTMQVGGPAKIFAVPENMDDLKKLLEICRQSEVKHFILGGGSNLIISDSGFDGMVISMNRFDDFTVEDSILHLGGGLEVSDAAWKAGSMGLQGLEFLFGMPGTVGGAVWMNARCYNSQISDVLEWIDTVDEHGNVFRMPMKHQEWSYKISPFQNTQMAILRCGFRIQKGEKNSLRKTMLDYRNDRNTKGHYRAPCAGSTFKNNRDFGVPTGRIIEECGLKGLKIGRAAVSDWHANIFINLGGAKALDFWTLIKKVSSEVKRQKGFRLEPEILSVGEQA